jgi:hypothetical protein
MWHLQPNLDWWLSQGNLCCCGRCRHICCIGVLHAMHQAIADSEQFAGVVHVGDCGGTGRSSFAKWCDWCTTGRSDGSGCCSCGRVGTMISSLASSNGGQTVHFGDGGNKVGQDVLGLRRHCLKKMYPSCSNKVRIASMTVVSCSAVLCLVTNDTIDCHPVLFDRISRVETALQLVISLAISGARTVPYVVTKWVRMDRTLHWPMTLPSLAANMSRYRRLVGWWQLTCKAYPF